MISEETVFIIGAGGSVPYGYPTGAGLRKMIVMDFPKRYKRLVTGERLQDTLSNEALDLAKTFECSSTQSIDLFLSRNHQYADVGKKAIILIILFSELGSRFREVAPNSDQDWYSHIFNRMTEKLINPDSWKEFKNNKVKFITFNYDRSLEYFLHESLSNSFTKAPKKEINDQINSIEFHHIYGKVSLLPWEKKTDENEIDLPYFGSETESFDKLIKSDKVNLLAKNIKIIHERSGDHLNEVIESIKHAKKIFFLGFGYAEENIKILQLDTILNGNQNIFGTTLGFLDSEKARVKRSLIKSFKIKDPGLNNPVLKPVDCLTLLREHL